MVSISNPILGFTLIVISGYFFGLLARKAHLPSIIGNLCAGIVFGPSCFNLFSRELIEEGLSPINSIAFGFIAISIALHLKIEEFKKVCVLSFSEIFFTFVFIFISSFIATSSLLLSVLLGITGATTAPAASLAIVQESRAKGPFVSALLPTIALNNVICTLMFTFFISLLGISEESSNEYKRILIPTFLGLLNGLLFCLAVPFVKKFKINTLLASFFALMILIGIAECLHVSILLSSICMGLVITNTKSVADEVFDAFNKIESFIYLLFFTIAGAHLNPTFVIQNWTLIFLFLIARTLGKITGGYIGSSFIGLHKRKLFGIGLIPQAGLALTFLLLVEKKVPLILGEIYSAIVLSSVILNEFIGSIATKILFKITKEEGKAYPPIFGFITSKDVIIGLEAEDKWEAIAKLVHQLCLRQKLPSEGRVLEEVIKRELSMTTGIGKCVAIPHGTGSNQSSIVGIFAISHKGIEFEAMDGRPVHFIILSLIPKDKLEAHLKYLTELSRIFSKPFVSSALLEARTEEEVIKILWEAQQ